jgi:hypothetical protein
LLLRPNPQSSGSEERALLEAMGWEPADVATELCTVWRQVFVEIGDWRPLFPTRVGEELGDIGAARFNIYNKELESQLILATSEFYARESSQWIGTDSCPEYMKKVPTLRRYVFMARSCLARSCAVRGPSRFFFAVRGSRQHRSRTCTSHTQSDSN